MSLRSFALAGALASGLSAAASPAAAITMIPVSIEGVGINIAVGIVTGLFDLLAPKNVNVGIADSLLIRSTPRSLFVEYASSVTKSGALRVSSEGPHWAFAFSVSTIEDEDRVGIDDQVTISEGRLEHVVKADPHDLLPARRWDIPTLVIEADSDNETVTIAAKPATALFEHPAVDAEGKHYDGMSAALQGTSFDGNFSSYTFRLDAEHVSPKVPLPPAALLLLSAVAALAAAKGRGRFRRAAA